MSSASEVKPIPTMVTDRAGAPPEGTLVITPTGRPNMVITLMTPIAQVLVRALRTYVQGLIGFLLIALAAAPTLANVGVVIEPGDFSEALAKSAGLALAPAVVSLLQNTVELLAKLDAMFPKARA